MAHSSIERHCSITSVGSADEQQGYADKREVTGLEHRRIACSWRRRGARHWQRDKARRRVRRGRAADKDNCARRHSGARHWQRDTARMCEKVIRRVRSARAAEDNCGSGCHGDRKDVLRGSSAAVAACALLPH